MSVKGRNTGHMLTRVLCAYWPDICNALNSRKRSISYLQKEGCILTSELNQRQGCSYLLSHISVHGEDGGYRSILDRGSDIFFSNTTGTLSVVPMRENFHTFQNSKSNS